MEGGHANFRVALSSNLDSEFHELLCNLLELFRGGMKGRAPIVYGSAACVTAAGQSAS